MESTGGKIALALIAIVLIGVIVAVIIILAGVFFIVRSIQNSYEDDSLYYED